MGRLRRVDQRARFRNLHDQSVAGLKLDRAADDIQELRPVTQARRDGPRIAIPAGPAIDEANRAPSSLCGTPTFPRAASTMRSRRCHAVLALPASCNKPSAAARSPAPNGRRTRGLNRPSPVNGRTADAAATDVHAMRPHAPPKGDDSGRSRQTTPSARPMGDLQTNRTYTGALAAICAGIH